MLWNACEHFGPLFIVVALTLFSQGSMRNLHMKRQYDELDRLRSAVRVSLDGLRDLYQKNMDTLANEAGPLRSGRNHINVLRIQFGRLLCLDVAEIESILRANNAAEEAETVMAMAGKAVGGVAYSLPEDNNTKGTLELAFNAACTKLGTAKDLIDSLRRFRPDAVSEDGATPEPAIFEASSSNASSWDLGALRLPSLQK